MINKTLNIFKAENTKALFWIRNLAKGTAAIESKKSINAVFITNDWEEYPREWDIEEEKRRTATRKKEETEKIEKKEAAKNWSLFSFSFEAKRKKPVSNPSVNTMLIKAIYV